MLLIPTPPFTHPIRPVFSWTEWYKEVEPPPPRVNFRSLNLLDPVPFWILGPRLVKKRPINGGTLSGGGIVIRNMEFYREPPLLMTTATLFPRG